MMPYKGVEEDVCYADQLVGSSDWMPDLNSDAAWALVPEQRVGVEVTNG